MIARPWCVGFVSIRRAAAHSRWPRFIGWFRAPRRVTMGMFKVYVGNLDRKATADDVRTLFVAFPDVEDIALATDKEGNSRCFAIVMFRDKQRGQLAIEVLKGKKMHGRELVINEVQKKPKGGAAEKPVARGPFGPRGPGGMGTGRGPGGPRGLGGGASRGPAGPRGLGGASRGPGGPRGLGGSSAGGREGGAGGFSRNPRRSPGASGGRPSGDRPSGDRPGGDRPGFGGSRPGFGSSRPSGPSSGSPRPSGSGDRGPLGPRFGQQDRPAGGPRPGGSGGTGPSRPAPDRPDEPHRPERESDGGAA